MGWKKGELLSEGKTKRIFRVQEHPELVWVQNKDKVTANDDEAFTKRFDSKAVCATKTTAKIFQLLNDCGLPTAFVEQVSDNEFIAAKCEMIPLEVIARRLAVGSFVKRRPELKAPAGQKPYRFHAVLREFFLKTTKGKLEKGNNSQDLGLPEIPAKQGTKPLDDPLIKDVYANSWELMMPKQPAWEQGANLDITVDPEKAVLPANPEIKIQIAYPESLSLDVIKAMDKLNHKAFLVIEKAWALLGYVLVDWKIEFGWTEDGVLLISDVIDNDSWRLRDQKFQELSKQLHRDGLPLSEVEAKYGLVTDMVQQIRLPKQALVVWKGSDSDKTPELPLVPGVEREEIVLSGHKKTQACLAKLEELQRDYPDGGVIIAVVGMSNGLGPMLAAHTSWPVVSYPATAKDCPEDVWSSLRLPSQNPMATILSDKNAALYALNILALKNPAAYMIRQLAIESLDTGY
jgi:phosphoribosylaminoimidazole carboxylase/phosphoribosylaminoimidazole-succinocarboxamide synthase